SLVAALAGDFLDRHPATGIAHPRFPIGSLWVVSSRREPSAASCAPVFKPLFFQVKRLPCGAAVMVSGRPEDLGKAPDDPAILHCMQYIYNITSSLGHDVSRIQDCRWLFRFD